MTNHSYLLTQESPEYFKSKDMETETFVAQSREFIDNFNSQIEEGKPEKRASFFVDNRQEDNDKSYEFLIYKYKINRKGVFFLR